MKFEEDIIRSCVSTALIASKWYNENAIEDNQKKC